MLALQRASRVRICRETHKFCSATAQGLLLVESDSSPELSPCPTLYMLLIHKSDERVHGRAPVDGR